MQIFYGNLLKISSVVVHFYLNIIVYATNGGLDNIYVNNSTTTLPILSISLKFISWIRENTRAKIVPDKFTYEGKNVLISWLLGA